MFEGSRESIQHTVGLESECDESCPGTGGRPARLGRGGGDAAAFSDGLSSCHERLRAGSAGQSAELGPGLLGQ